MINHMIKHSLYISIYLSANQVVSNVLLHQQAALACAARLTNVLPAP